MTSQQTTSQHKLVTSHPNATHRFASDVMSNFFTYLNGTWSTWHRITSHEVRQHRKHSTLNVLVWHDTTSHQITLHAIWRLTTVPHPTSHYFISPRSRLHGITCHITAIRVPPLTIQLNTTKTPYRPNAGVYKKLGFGVALISLLPCAHPMGKFYLWLTLLFLLKLSPLAEACLSLDIYRIYSWGMQGLTLIPMPPRTGYPCSLSRCGTDQAGECPTNRLLPLLGRTTKFALRGQGEVAALTFFVFPDALGLRARSPKPGKGLSELRAVRNSGSKFQLCEYISIWLLKDDCDLFGLFFGFKILKWPL